MPRIAGQIDPRKSEAILQAASDLFAERGAAVTMAEIARKAGVSKQTLYNRFASKVEIGRALAARRSDDLTAPLRIEGDPVSVLTAYAANMLEKVCNSAKGESLRGVALMSPSVPDIAQAIYDAGPGESVRRIAAWLSEQDRLGLLSVPRRPVGPCCSFEPIGTMTVLDRGLSDFRRASISGQDDRWISMGTPGRLQAAGVR